MQRAAIHRVYGFFGRRFRPARMQRFRERLRPGPGTKILDIGGTSEFWAGSDLDVTLLNKRAPAHSSSDRKYIQADAINIPCEDQSFDIAFSNSMIEHLQTRENQQRAAREALRVAQRLWIQTPNRWFPMEPHYLTPFIHWLPRGLRRRLVRNFTLWGIMTRPSLEEARTVVDEIMLLSASDLRALFPGCQIVRERMLGLTKSFIVVR